MTQPTPDVVQREDLDPRRGECLVCYVDRMLARADCSGELRHALWWRGLRAPRASGLEGRLESAGARCDCEVLAIAYVEDASLDGRRVGLWDRPRCRGVRAGSTQPCSRWRRRPRWHPDLG